MAYRVIIAHLVSDENGRATGGQRGDQTGRESRKQEWYNSPWQNVFRPKSTKKAEKIAKAMETICDMPNLGGYNQNDRLSLANAAEKVKWELEKVTEPCNAYCSSAIAAALNAAGIEVPKDMYTGNEKTVLEKTGAFKTLTAKKYISKCDNLLRGDVLHKTGHTACVISKKYIITKEWRYAEKMIKGTEVKKIQEALNTLMDLDLDVDGIFGKHTGAAVVRFQKKKGLTPDGIVGKKTSEALGFAWR